jgi:D-sedoheptulose 7-phosphate isomerase
MTRLTDRYPVLLAVAPVVAAAFSVMAQALTAGRTLFICGNGGSAADAEHMVGELGKVFLLPRTLGAADRDRLRELGEDGAYLAQRLVPGLRAIALTGHPSLATALTNDVGADVVFAQQLYVLGEPGDVLVAVSTSGNARNVLLAALVAKARGMPVVGLTGAGGGRLRQTADVCICVPEQETYRVQEYHLPVYHTLCAMLEAHVFTGADGV